MLANFVSFILSLIPIISCDILPAVTELSLLEKWGSHEAIPAQGSIYISTFASSSSLMKTITSLWYYIFDWHMFTSFFSSTRAPRIPRTTVTRSMTCRAEACALSQWPEHTWSRPTRQSSGTPHLEAHSGRETYVYIYCN